MNYHLDEQGFVQYIDYPNCIFKFDQPLKDGENNLIQWIYKNNEYFGMFNATKNILIIDGKPHQLHGLKTELKHFLKTFAGNKND